MFALGGGPRRRPPRGYGAGADRRRHADAAARALLAAAHLRAVLAVGRRPVGAGDRPRWSRPRAVQGTLTQMGWFFTKAALLTFGGAYAVLPYVYQGAVEQLPAGSAAPQMIDGLALGETTPGPLIMVVAFVGFVGGWTQAAVRRPEALFARRRAGGGGRRPSSPSCRRSCSSSPAAPFVESTHGELGFTAPLTGDHRGGGRRDRQPGAVLRLARAVAAGLRRRLRRGRGGAGRGRRRGADPASRRASMPVIGACALAGLARQLVGG
ncbi:MAG: chromate transporter [Comamonadaceae bacterium]|nr:chromate transporter [Comamonadaceae bacterium]